MSFIAGHYDATWGDTPVDIGTTREGFRLLETHHAEMIVTDDFGDAPVDGVQRGTEARLSLDYVDYTLMAAPLYAQNPAGTNDNVGKLLTGLAEQLVLTAVAGTPAFLIAGGIKTLTAIKAIVVSDLETLMAARVRQGPCTFHLLPDPATGDPYVLTQGP